MWTLLSLIWLGTAAHAESDISSKDRAAIEEWRYSVDERLHATDCRLKSKRLKVNPEKRPCV